MLEVRPALNFRGELDDVIKDDPLDVWRTSGRSHSGNTRMVRTNVTFHFCHHKLQNIVKDVTNGYYLGNLISGDVRVFIMQLNLMLFVCSAARTLSDRVLNSDVLAAVKRNKNWTAAELRAVLTGFVPHNT